jgi:hypothetical protein
MTNIVQFAGGTFVDSENFSNKVQIDPAPVVEITGNASVDDSTADGATENNITFIALDEDGNGCAAYLEFTSDSGTAVLGAETAMTDYESGEVTISITDTVGEVVTVTAKQAGGDVSGTAETTFTAVSGGGEGIEGTRARRPGKGRISTGDYPIHETEEERVRRERDERRREGETDEEYSERLKKAKDEAETRRRERHEKDKERERTSPPPQSGGRANPSSPASGSRDKSNLPPDIDPSVVTKTSPPAAGSLSDKKDNSSAAVARDKDTKK